MTVVISFILIGCSDEDSPLIPSYEGVVINSMTNQPFEGVTVSVTNGSDTKLSTTTNAQGEFNFSLSTEGLSGEYYIQVGNANTEKKQIQITGVGKVKNDLGIIKLIPDTKPTCLLTDLKLRNGVIELTGEIESSGYSDIISVGFILSSDQEMSTNTLDIKGVISGNTFSGTIDETKLKDNGTYFFFAYAKNSAGIGYSDPKQLDQESMTPLVRWRNNKESFDYEMNVINLTATTLTLQAYIANDGGSSLTEYGICWSEDGTPTVSGNHKSMNGGTVGEYFTITIDGLSPVTTYFIRPYAKNRLNAIGYGLTTYITTKYLPSAQVSLDSNLTVGTTQVECNGTVSYTNCTLEEVGFCYSLHADPKVSDYKIKADNTGRSYTCLINNLKEGTAYYVRPYIITTEKEVFYGNVKAITTLVNVKITVIDPDNKPISDARVSIVGGNIDDVNTYQYRTGTNGVVKAILEVANYRVIVTSSPYAQRIVNLDVNSSLQPLTIQMSY